MKYKLKSGVESFEVVDGEFAGKKFFRGKVYEKIPQEEAKNFEKVQIPKVQSPKVQKQKTSEPITAQQAVGQAEGC